jgi:hypothetical protein
VNTDLIDQGVPHPDAPWSEIAAFAYARGERLGFENFPYDLRSFAAECLHWFRQKGEVPSSPGDVDRCLYGLQRLHHWSDRPPDAEEMTLARVLIAQLRGSDHTPNMPPEQIGDRVPVLTQLLEEMSSYRRARLALLAALGVAAMQASNRDPLAEFSEVLSASLHGGRLADSRVQKGYDVIAASGERVQVRFLANASGTWVNGHVIQVIPDVERYDLVVFENLTPIALLSFPLSNLDAIAMALRKRHPETDRTIQLTRANVRQMMETPQTFEALGARISAFPRLAGA